MVLELTAVHARRLTVVLVTIVAAPIGLKVDTRAREVRSRTGTVTRGGPVVRKTKTNRIKDKVIDPSHRRRENRLDALKRTVIEHLTARTAHAVTELAA
jgi:hypothetical protein